MNTKFGKSAIFGAVLICALMLKVPAANATSIAYSFTGSGVLAGTSFNYVDPAGFLAFDTGELSPPIFPMGDLFITGIDEGPVTGFDFISTTSFSIHAGLGSSASFFNISPYILGAFGSENLGYPQIPVGTLVISAVNVSEPRSLFLLVITMIGLVGAGVFESRRSSLSRLSRRLS